MSEYIKFLINNFPKTKIISDSNIELCYKRVCENNLICEIVQKYIYKYVEDNQMISPKYLFLERYRIQLNKILLYIPIGDQTIINFGMRSAIENILKFIYTMCFDQDYEKVSGKKFRTLKEELLIKYKDEDIIKEEIIKLFSYYGKYSNEVHEKEIIIEDIDSLQKILEEGNINIQNLLDDILNIFNAYQKIIFYTYEINQMTLSSAELLRLRKTLPSKRYIKVLNLMC